jgi:hypothetical protein
MAKHLKLFEEFENEFDNKIENVNIQAVLDSYLESLMWSSGEEFDEYTIYNFTERSIDSSRKDIISFVNQAGDLLDDYPDNMIGHNFALSRNGHGTGFFDDFESCSDEEICDELEKIASSFKNVSVFVNDDNELDIE